MKFKRILAIAAAAILSIPCLSGLSAQAAGYNAYLAGVYGEAQENAVWSYDKENNYPVPEGCKTAVVDGDGTYEVEWVMAVPLTTSPRTEFMCIFIDGLGSANYPSLEITVDAVIVDGTQIEYTQSANSCDYAYGGGTTSRAYLKDNWAGTGVADIDEYITINNSIKVIFTVSGMGIVGNSNIGDDAPEGDVSDSSSESESESSSSVSESEPESSSSVSESESESESSSSVSESKSEASSQSQESTSEADADDAEDEGGMNMLTILLIVLGVGVVVAAIIIIIKVRNSRYYL